MEFDQDDDEIYNEFTNMIDENVLIAL